MLPPPTDSRVAGRRFRVAGNGGTAPGCVSAAEGRLADAAGAAVGARAGGQGLAERAVDPAPGKSYGKCSQRSVG